MTKASLSDVADELLNDLSQDVEGTLIESSQWKIRRIPMTFIKVYKSRVARGSSYIPTPPPYNNAKCGLINIQNDDQECFKWCMKYHQTEAEEARRPHKCSEKA
jgi:hypothetical protein